MTQNLNLREKSKKFSRTSHRFPKRDHKHYRTLVFHLERGHCKFLQTYTSYSTIILGEINEILWKAYKKIYHICNQSDDCCWHYSLHCTTTPQVFIFHGGNNTLIKCAIAVCGKGNACHYYPSQEKILQLTKQLKEFMCLSTCWICAKCWYEGVNHVNQDDEKCVCTFYQVVFWGMWIWIWTKRQL